MSVSRHDTVVVHARGLRKQYKELRRQLAGMEEQIADQEQDVTLQRLASYHDTSRGHHAFFVEVLGQSIHGDYELFLVRNPDSYVGVLLIDGERPIFWDISPFVRFRAYPDKKFHLGIFNELLDVKLRRAIRQRKMRYVIGLLPDIEHPRSYNHTGIGYVPEWDLHFTETGTKVRKFTQTGSHGGNRMWRELSLLHEDFPWLVSRREDSEENFIEHLRAVRR